MPNRYYIAYGSNLNLLQMRMRCPEAKVVGTSVIKNYGLVFRGRRNGAYLTIEPCENGRVPVAVWEVNEANERSLDRYEGFPVFYDKSEMELMVSIAGTGEKHAMTGFAYIMSEGRPINQPSNLYFMTCVNGYRSFEFDLQTLLDAHAKSKEVFHV